MSWRGLLLLPTLIKHGLKAPRDAGVAWDRYWGAVRRTGAGGDVLWDGASERELAWVVETARRYFDPNLPLVDLGCGNGRYTRGLAPLSRAAWGVDVSENAVRRARSESDESSTVSYRLVDVTSNEAGRALARELGAANVFVRGVLHVLDTARRLTLVENIERLLNGRGKLFVLETAFEGTPLAYLEYLGARGTHFPGPVLRCIEAGLPTPARFGASELDRFFPVSRWDRLEAGATELDAVAMRSRDDSLTSIPGYYAILSSKQRPGT